ncbi:MAG TPA: hypothetical protein DD979_09810 [Gammaproteobacteria bacterium]|jgi:predicted GH43/DUF377 family glycosyl hydrolase|nr:hypothetical protein [Gammaproteobacteria bacterium]
MEHITRISRTGVLLAIGLAFIGCGTDSDNADTGTLSGDFPFANLQHWQRHGEPVLRDPEPGGGYEVAADPHPFRTQTGSLRMVYSGPHPDNDYATIKLATANDPTQWSVGPVLLSGTNAGGLDLNKETAFYRLATSGKHQIYYIGYEDGAVYHSQIFMAEADTLEGPYRLPTAPIVPTSVQDGFEVKTITSPSIVEHDGQLYMAYCAWDGFPDPTAVQVHGAISNDDGQTWNRIGEVNAPVCMEGAFSKGPDGKFYAVAQAEGGLTLGRSDVPFPDAGYEMLAQPVMTPAGAPWEVDELNTPQIFFEGSTAYLYYSGADFSKGWWIMLATTDLEE